MSTPVDVIEFEFWDMCFEYCFDQTRGKWVVYNLVSGRVYYETDDPDDALSVCIQLNGM